MLDHGSTCCSHQVQLFYEMVAKSKKINVAISLRDARTVDMAIENIACLSNENAKRHCFFCLNYFVN